MQKRYEAKKPYWKNVSAVALSVVACLIPVLGMLPAMTMDALADLAQGFLGVHHTGHAVHYFTWVNLKGSVISVAIGAVLYLTVVRRWMLAEGVYECPGWSDSEEHAG